MASTTSRLPSDHRSQQGGLLFLGSLLIFFMASLVMYGVYAYSRRGEVELTAPLPARLLVSTFCLLIVSGLLHAATRTVRREKRRLTTLLLSLGGVAACLFMWVQFQAMREMLDAAATSGGPGRGVVGMVAVLAFLHALHVAGGVLSLGIVSVRSLMGRYDHERHWPIDFSAHYWHFLDGVWLCMLVAFWGTTGGFGF